jgi:hypothetical protein
MTSQQGSCRSSACTRTQSEGESVTWPYVQERDVICVYWRRRASYVGSSPRGFRRNESADKVGRRRGCGGSRSVSQYERDFCTAWLNLPASRIVGQYKVGMSGVGWHVVLIGGAELTCDWCEEYASHIPGFHALSLQWLCILLEQLLSKHLVRRYFQHRGPNSRDKWTSAVQGRSSRGRTPYVLRQWLWPWQGRVVPVRRCRGCEKCRLSCVTALRTLF